MKSLGMKFLFAGAALVTLLSGCATYDYGYNGYAYSYPGYYDPGYTYYGPGYYSYYPYYYPYYPYYYGGPVISGGVVISGHTRNFRGTRSFSSNQTFNGTRVVTSGNQTATSGTGSHVVRNRVAHGRNTGHANGRFVEREKAG
jgi:hypothetical protein